MNEDLIFFTDFYQNLWTNFLWVIGGFGFILGILWPTFIFFLNREKGKNYEKKLNNIFEEKKVEVDRLIAEAIKKVDEKMRRVEDKIIEIENNESRLTGNMFFTQAQATNDPFLKILGLLNAYISFIKAEDMSCMTMVYFSMSPYFQHGQTLLTNNTMSLEKIQIIENCVENILEGLEQKKQILNCTNYIGIFEKFKKQLMNI